MICQYFLIGITKNSEARAEYIAHERAVNNRLAKLTKENEALVSENQTLTAENQTLTAENQVLAAEIEHLRAQLAKLEK